MKGVCELIALYIFAAVLLLIAAILLLPVSAYLEYNNDFFFDFKFSGINVFSSKKEKKQTAKKSTKKTVKKTPPQEKKENQFKTSFEILKKKKGFSGAVKEIFALLNDCLKHLGFLLKTFKFRKVEFNLNVATENAAKTAIEYGALCSAIYPTLSFFQSIGNVKYKKINVKSDFESQKANFDFSLAINSQILFLIIAAFKVYKEYKKFSIRNGL